MSRLNNISAVVTLYRDQIHSLESNVTPTIAPGDDAATSGLEDVENKKKPSGAATLGVNLLTDTNASTEVDSRKKSSVYAIAVGKEEHVNTEEDTLLVFSENRLKTLQKRTEELKTERTMQKNKFRYSMFRQFHIMFLRFNKVAQGLIKII